MRNTKATLENANRPTSDEFGRPLGRRHATFWEWFPLKRPLKGEGDVLDEYGYPDYKRREYKYVNGVRGKLIPMTYGQGRRRDEGPRGGRGWQYYHFRLYLVDMGLPLVCRHRHERVDYDEMKGFTYHDYWEPYTGIVYGIDGCSRRLVLQDGLILKEEVA